MKHLSHLVAFEIAVGLAVLASFPADAQTRPKGVASNIQASRNVSAVSDPITVLQKFTIDDLTAAKADADAQTPPDTVASNCYAALIPVVQNGASNPLPKGLGAFQLYQKTRDLKALVANLKSPNGPLSSLNVACAPLVIDVQATLIQLGVIGGIAVGTGGLIP